MISKVPNYVTLHGTHSSIVLECAAHEAPIWRYWGARLPDATLPPTSLRSARPTPPASLEFDQPLTIAPTFGNGWFGQAALLAHRNGQQFAHAWNICTVDQTRPHTLCITLCDTVAAIRLVVQITLTAATDVLEINTCLHNDDTTEAAALTVQWLAAATLPLPNSSTHVNSYIGQWANEFQPQTDALSRSTWRRENTRGRTSHDCFPAATISSAQSSEVFGAHLAWSGNHTQTIEWQHDGNYQWQLGQWLAPGEIQLQHGECLQSPTVYAAYSPAGLDALAQAFHAAVRAKLPWNNGVMRPRPVHLNTWEAVYFDHNETGLKALVTAAAELGVERFVLDDGWFHGRNNDRAGLGDWWADSTKYPNGLAPLANHVIKNGMEFGLWIEPEMVNADSDLFRAHPDWALQLDDRALLTGRNQLVLNIANRDVEHYLFETMSKLFTSLPISYLKWDMNRDLAQAGMRLEGRESAAYTRYVTALYALLARLSSAFPALEIESCASGGGRSDYGILRYTHRVWASDCNDALSRLTIQHGALQWLPPEIIGSHIGAAPAHTTGRTQSLAFRAAVAITGHFGLELDVGKLTPSEHAELKPWIMLYRRLRDALHQAKVWRGAAGDGITWQAHEKNGSFIVCVYRAAPTSQRWSPTLKLPMLDAACTYDIENLTPAPNNNAFTSPTHGAWLRTSGLALPRMLAESALILRFVQST